MLERIAITVLVFVLAYLLRESIGGDREALASLVGIGLFAALTFRRE